MTLQIANCGWRIVRHAALRVCSRVLPMVMLMAVATPVALAHPNRTPYRIDPYSLDSGVHQGAGRQTVDELPSAADRGATPDRDREADSGQSRVAFAQTIQVPGAPWLRLHIADYDLGQASFIVIRSVQTGAEQTMTATALQIWSNHTPFFGGDALEFELHVAPGEQNIFAQISEVWVGLAVADDDSAAGPGGGDPPESLCGADDRVASSDPRVGRLFIGGRCTAWLASNGAFLTAGHCVDTDPDQSGPGLPDGVIDCSFLSGVVEFNVPPSLPNGVPQPAMPEDQYIITGDCPVLTEGFVAWQFAGSNGTFNSIGADWAVFHVGPNANLETPQQRQNAFFRVTDVEPDVGDIIRVTGHGLDNTPAGSGDNRCLFGANHGQSCVNDMQCPAGTCMPPAPCDSDNDGNGEFNCNAQHLTQQTATGPYNEYVDDGANDVSHEYEVDTTGGTSGGPVILESLDAAIGINTNSGCGDGFEQDENYGTAFEQDTLAQFLNDYIYGPGVRYRDSTNFGSESGNIFDPHRTVTAAVAVVADGADIVIIPGNYTAASGNTFTAGADGRAMTLIAPFGGVAIGN